MNLIKIIIHRKTFVSMVFLGLSLLGYISYSKLPMEMMPNVELPFLIVQVRAQRDMNPSYMEKQAVIPLEGAVGTLEGISKIESQAEQRRGTIYLYYDASVNINFAYIKLQEKVNEIASTLPDEFNVSVVKVDTERISNMFMRLQVRGSGGLERVRAIIDKSIQENLENIDGISLVEVTGGRMKSVEIILDEQAVEANNITTGQIVSLINQNSAKKTFVGHAYESSRHFFVNLTADYTNIRDLENIVVDSRGPTLLKDIATVYFGEKEETEISRVNGKDAVTVQLVRDSNVNLIELSHITRDVIAGINKDLKAQDIEIVIQSDTAEDMENNINLIKQLAIIGGFLAVAILWFFLKNIRLVTIILLAIPISILTAFNFFYAFDISLNSLTLVGMALAIGMLLDNSVVVLENIYRHVGLGKDRDTAVILGTSEVWRSIVASTLTTIIVFLPFVFSTNELVRMIGRHIGISIISTLIVSLVIALVLIPAATHLFLKNQGARNYVFSKVSYKNRLVQIYTLCLKSAVRFPARTIIGTVVLFFASIIICLSMSLDVATEIDLKEFSLFVTMPTGSTLERTDEIVKDLESKLDDIAEKQDVIATVYEEEATITIVLRDDYETVAGRSIVDIKSDIQDRIDNFRVADVSLDEPQVSSARFGGGGGGMNPVASMERMFGIGTQQESIVIKGNDYELIKGVADDLEYYIEDLDTIRRTSLSAAGNRPEIHLLFDRLLMSSNEVQLSSITSELNSFQREISTQVTFKQGTEEYDIIIRDESVEEDEEMTFDDLKDLDIQNAGGGTFDLENLGRMIYSYGLSRISRLNQEKQIELVYSFESEVNDSKAYLETSREEVDSIVASLSLPPGVAVEVVHDESELTEFYFLIAAAFILIYMILASVFESLVTPIVMMFTIPLATIGSFWALILTGNSIMNANSLIGFLILLGVVVNNGIILIDYNRILRARGYRMSRALMTAGQARVRPILITAITTIIALIPLAMGKAEYVTRIGAPFAITVIGGLTLGTVFTLIFIPTVYSALENALIWLKGLSKPLKVMQFIALAASSYFIYYYVESAIWIGAYLLLAVTGIPGMTWFILTSLRRAQTEYVSQDAKLFITIQRLVKIYDGDSRFVREWKKGDRIKESAGYCNQYRSWRDFDQISWQLPVLAFMVYFIYFYLDSQTWLFLLSHAVYFFLLFMVAPFKLCFEDMSQRSGKRFAGAISTLMHHTVFWGFPAFSLALFKLREFRLGMIIFIAIVWFTALFVYTISNRLHRKNINIMRLTGRLAGLRRLIYRIVRSIPIIGKKKTPFNALDSVSIDIQSGMFGLLGPNGAGKTTLMRTVCGILEKSMGTIRLNNIDFAEKREELQGLIGYLPQEFGTYENMTAYEFLDYLAILNGMYDTAARHERVSFSLASVHLTDQKDKKIGSFSGGMKQRMGIALTLLHLPRVLVVDEPTAGLDPRERIRFRNVLVELSRDRIVIFSTHIIEDISSSCNNVAVLDRGNLHYLGAPQKMTDKAMGHVWQFMATENEFNELRNTLRIVHHMRVGDNIKVRCLSESEPHAGAQTVQPTLEDAYLWLLGDRRGQSPISV